ncbi:uncharacterized protein LOC126266956 [Schistocerca gregaria]|uniref:uncharacterized protein LOC126266956 n=1 Tax=Schistocerca gregaria TaxID=7010 RepID=UPI00211DEC52|nr:uncharacterized protein LOC126266956 [Schistocerca gregaria]
MKTTISALVAAICLTVSPGDAASMEGAFVNATRIIPPPDVTYYIVNGTATRDMMIAAVSSYIATMTEGLGYQTANSVRATYNTMRHMEQGVQHDVYEIQNGANVTFDASLSGLAVCYRNFSAAVKNGLRYTKHFSSQGNLRTGARQQKEIRIWDLDEAFVHLPETVAPELQKLHDWIVEFAYIGISNATAELPAVMEDLRVQYLYPDVAAAMVKAYNLQQSYDDLFQQYTNPDIYSEYAAARDELLSLEIE